MSTTCYCDYCNQYTKHNQVRDPTYVTSEWECVACGTRLDLVENDEPHDYDHYRGQS